jgi:hypothetical protein
MLRYQERSEREFLQYRGAHVLSRDDESQLRRQLGESTAAKVCLGVMPVCLRVNGSEDCPDRGHDSLSVTGAARN